MGLFSRLGRRAGSIRPGHDSEARARTLAHLRQFAASRTGVEAYVEPATRIDPTTVVLVARTGEWTRRRVPDARAAWALAREMGIPVYDVHLTGYPARMREWNARQREPRDPSG